MHFLSVILIETDSFMRNANFINMFDKYNSTYKVDKEIFCEKKLSMQK